MERKKLKRIAYFVLAVVLLGVLGKLFGLEAYAKPSVMKSWLLGLGAWGMLAYVAFFVVASLSGAPGLLFVAAGVFVFGGWKGGALAVVASVIAVTVQFMIARATVGQALVDTQWGWMEKVLARLDARPVLTVVVLRIVAQLSPPVNYALAWSKIRWRDYVVGSVIGLSLVLAAIVPLMGCFFSTPAA